MPTRIISRYLNYMYIIYTGIFRLKKSIAKEKEKSWNSRSRAWQAFVIHIYGMQIDGICFKTINRERARIMSIRAHSSLSIHSWHLLYDISPWHAIYWAAGIFEGSTLWRFAPDKLRIREKCREINVGSNLRDRFNYSGIPQIAAGIPSIYTGTVYSRYSMANNRPNMPVVSVPLMRHSNQTRRWNIFTSAWYSHATVNVAINRNWWF